MSREIQPYPTEPSSGKRTSTCSLMVMIALCLSIGATGCLAGRQTNSESRDAKDTPDHSSKIEALKASIERDHRTLEDLITQPGLEADRSLHENPELRAIAQRLTAQERALEQLESGSPEMTN